MSAPQVLANGSGFIVHKLRLPFGDSKKTYSAWLNAAMELEDCEGRTGNGPMRPVDKVKNSAQWSAVKVAARLIVKGNAPLTLPIEQKRELSRLLDTLESLNLPAKGQPAQIGAGMLANLKESATRLKTALPSL